jgi:alpha-glucoside transport system substrate-binding protein
MVRAGLLFARAVPFAAALMVLFACGGKGDGAAGPGQDTQNGRCAEFAAFQGHPDTNVTVFSPIRDVEGDNLVRGWEPFEACTGINVEYRGSDTFETELPQLVRSGNPPDIAIFPQPSLIDQMARDGSLRPASPGVQEEAHRWYPEDWLRYVTVDGILYGAPLEASVKSLVWYSPRMFAANGYAVPQTWAEMLALTERIAADGVTPWCAGIGSGVATGWPATDWLEDVLLRTIGPDGYDDWVANRITFDDPRVVAALDQVGQILKNPRYVNGGYGGVETIVTTAFQEGGLPILEGKCAMHRQANFYSNFLPDTAVVGENGDIYAFYLPALAGDRPVLGAGTFVGAFSDRPEVSLMAQYLATPAFANEHARTSNAVSPNRGLDPKVLSQPVSRLASELLARDDVDFRFDGSDLMPTAVGTGTFWRGMTEWIQGRPSHDVLADIQASWPR